MQVVILAGGRGQRLKPFTTVIPKPLMPLGEQPILDVIIRQLKSFGATEVILAVGYLAKYFETIFESGERYGLKIKYSLEQEPMGTAGPLSLVFDQLDDNFLVMNGDVLTTLDYKSLMAFHLRNEMDATIAMYQREVKIDFGVLHHDPETHLLSEYQEKPVLTYNVSMGVNVFRKSAIEEYLVKPAYLDIPNLMMKLKASGKRVGCFQEPCFWLDIGRIDDYGVALDIFEARKDEFLRKID